MESTSHRSYIRNLQSAVKQHIALVQATSTVENEESCLTEAQCEIYRKHLDAPYFHTVRELAMITLWIAFS